MREISGENVLNIFDVLSASEGREIKVQQLDSDSLNLRQYWRAPKIKVRVLQDSEKQNDGGFFSFSPLSVRNLK